MTEPQKNTTSKSEYLSAASVRTTFSGPLGAALGTLGILTAAQQAESGEVQAQMIALRQGVEEGLVEFDDPKGTISGLSRKSEAERSAILSACGITEGQLAAARDIVENARTNRGNVNEGHDIAVSPIGFIHTDLHAKSIPNFPVIKESLLVAQRAIDISDAADRLGKGAPDAAAGAKRGFRLFGDESAALKDAVQWAQAQNELESEGKPAAHPDKAFAGALIDYAATRLQDAGYAAQAAQLGTLKTALGIAAQDTPDTAPDTAPDNAIAAKSAQWTSSQAPSAAPPAPRRAPG